MNGIKCIRRSSCCSVKVILSKNSIVINRITFIVWFIILIKLIFVYFNTILQTYPKNVNKVCVLGFGIGGLPLALSKNNNIIKIDCVDIEIKMFEMFKTINPNPPKKIHYYLNDVNEYIRTSDQKYDMIVDDTYSTEKIIVDYSSLKKMLVPNGILFINIINYDASLKLAEELKKTYKNVSHQRVNFNYLITCYRGSD